MDGWVQPTERYSTAGAVCVCVCVCVCDVSGVEEGELCVITFTTCKIVYRGIEERVCVCVCVFVCVCVCISSSQTFGDGLSHMDILCFYFLSMTNYLTNILVLPLHLMPRHCSICIGLWLVVCVLQEICECKPCYHSKFVTIMQLLHGDTVVMSKPVVGYNSL